MLRSTPSISGNEGAASVDAPVAAFEAIHKEDCRKQVTRRLIQEFDNRRQFVDDGFEHGYAAYLAKKECALVDSPNAYIFKCARNWILKALKNEERFRQVLRDSEQLAVANDLQAAIRSIEASASERSVSYALHECLQRLRPKFRDIIQSRYWLEFTFDEIARSNGTTAKALRTAASRALPLLRKCIENKLGSISRFTPKTRQ